MEENSEKLFERSQAIIPGGVHSPVRAFKSVGGTPIFFKSSRGPWLISVENETYIDFCQSFGPMILGHRDDDVLRAVHKMVDTAWCLGACEPYSLELASWITERIPWVEKIRFVNSGTEAVMSSLRLARAFTGRKKILKFDGCYHGHVDSMLVKAGSGLAGIASSDSAGVTEEDAANTLVASLDSEESVEKIFAQFGNEIAAVIIEPLPANYGLLLQRHEFLKKVVEIARAYKSLVIFDEVISGFRVALGGMAELTGVAPDLVTYGKVIGGGFNVAAYGGRRDIMDLIAPSGPVYQAGTLSANPIGMRAGLATLEKIEKTFAYKTLSSRTNAFCASLQNIFKNADIPLKVVNQGSVFWIHSWTTDPIRSLKDIPKEHGQNFKKFFHSALENGVYLAPSGYEVGFMSLAHDEEVLIEALHGLEIAAKEAYGKN